MDSCSCGCGEEVSKEGNKYILGHYAKLNPPMKNREIARKSGKSKEGKPNFWKGKTL